LSQATPKEEEEEEEEAALVREDKADKDTWQVAR
jgi:hypothetical protein